MTQWQSELKQKFNQVFADFRGPVVRVLESQNPQENVWALQDNVVTSTTFAAYADGRAKEIAAAGWDLVVVDEAHHARRTRHGDRQESTKLYRLLERLVDPEFGRTSSALFLTATPMQLDPFELYSLIELLDPTLFVSPEDFERHRSEARGLSGVLEALEDWDGLDAQARDAAVLRAAELLGQESEELARAADEDGGRKHLAEEIVGAHRLSQIMVRNRKQTVGGFMPRVAAVWPVELTPAERAAYEAITRYAREGFARSQAERRLALGFVMVMFQKLATSSSAALRRSLLRRIEKLEEQIPDAPAPGASRLMADEDSAEEFDEAVEEVGEQQLADIDVESEGDAIWKEVKELEQIVGLLDAIPVDSKTTELIDRLEEIRTQDGDPRVIVFTQFRGTQDELAARIPHPWSVNIFHGQLSPPEKDSAVARFRDSSGPQVLVSTEAGGEGRNFQFAHILVNYDLPWNPMKVEQRIGRVDRIGQKKPVIVASFSTGETVEERVVEVLARRVRVFEETIGGLDPILGEVERDLRKLFLLADQEATRAQARLGKTLEHRIQKAREAEAKLRDLIMDQRSMVAAEVDQLLARARTTTEEDMRRFCLQALDEVGATLEKSKVHGVYDLELRGRSQDVFPQLVREQRRRQITFDRAVAQDHDEVDFLAFGHELVDGLVARVCGDRYPGRSSVRIVQTDAVAPCAGWFMVYAIELDGIVRRRELYPVFVDESGVEQPATAQALLQAAAEIHREEHFGDGPPEGLPNGDASVEQAASIAQTAALTRMLELQEELEPANDARLQADREKLERFFEYKRTAAEMKLAHAQQVFERVSNSTDTDVQKIIPAWAAKLERARRDKDSLEADRTQRLEQLEARANVSARTSLLAASYALIEPDPRPLIAAVKERLPKDIATEFGRFCGRPTDPQLVDDREAVRHRRVQLKRLAASHEFDHERAQQIGQTLETMFGSMDQLSQPQRVVIHAAARYYLNVSDQEHDLHSRDGFLDDDAVVSAVRDAIAAATA